MRIASRILPRLALLFISALFSLPLPVSAEFSGSAKVLAASQQRIPGQTSPKTGAMQGIIRDSNGTAIGGATIVLRNIATGEIHKATSTAQGVFRLIDLPPGKYELNIAREGYASFVDAGVSVVAGE